MNMIILAGARDKLTGMPENFGGLQWKDVTNIHPLGLTVVLILGMVMLFVPRRWTILPILIIACFISSVQKIVIFSLDFNLLRIMVVFGIVRIFIRGEYKSFTSKSLDKIVILWTISSFLIYTIRIGTVSAMVNRLGFAFDVFGMYFVFRCLVQNWQDIDRVILSCIFISIPVMAAFLYEQSTGHNIFSVFGGVPEMTVVREGRLRCQGAFSHAILAGCFWASLMPLVASQWWKSGKGKFWAITGLIATSTIIVCCASSTPVIGILTGILGGCMYYFRNYMRQIRWGFIISLITLHLVMRAPVWHLISRINVVGGSTGWHRFYLIDNAIKHFNEWWLLGIDSTLHWGPGMYDITNQFVFEGIQGGIITLALFILVIVYGFMNVGQILKTVAGGFYRYAISWALGVSLFIHCMNFMSVSYFGEIYVAWYLLLALIGSLSVQPKTFAESKIRSSANVMRNRRS